ncbi:MAG: colicin-like bacteriocin tRNase domain-containing protein [Morganella sp. (in: enterobacteria)]
MGKNNSGGYGGSNLGGHTTDHGNGKSTTSDNRGDISHHTDSGGSKGDHGRGRGSGGSGGSSSSRGDAPENASRVNIAHAGIPLALYPVSGVLTVSLSWPTITAAVREAFIGLDTYLGNSLARTAPYAGRLLGVVVGSLLPGQIAPDPKFSYNLKDPLVDKDSPYSVTALPAELVTSVPVADIPKNTTVPARVLAQAVIDELTQTRPITITPVKSTPVPVVKAQKTNKHNVYTAQVVPGMKPVRIHISSYPDKFQVMPNSTPAVKQYLSHPDEGRSHHAILDFGRDHAPVYVSVTKQLKPEEEKKLAEKARKEWVTDNSVGVIKVLTDINTLIINTEKRMSAKQQELRNKQVELQDLSKELMVKNARDKKKREINLVINQLTADLSNLQKELADAEGNKTLNEKTLTELKEQELNQVKTPEDAEKELAAANIALTKARARVTEKEKPLAAKRQELKNKQAELQDLNKELMVKNARDKKKREINLVINQLSTEVGLLEKALSDAMESRNKAEGKKKAAEDKVREAKDKKRQGVKEKGHDYHPAPKTEEIKGLGDLNRADPRTPKKGGSGKRTRWTGDKGRKVYEWDSQHGEIEGYRASDGQHIGAFDPKTGNQLKPADPKRNITKYL